EKNRIVEGLPAIVGIIEEDVELLLEDRVGDFVPRDVEAAAVRTVGRVDDHARMIGRDGALELRGATPMAAFVDRRPDANRALAPRGAACARSFVEYALQNVHAPVGPGGDHRVECAVLLPGKRDFPPRLAAVARDG